MALFATRVGLGEGIAPSGDNGADYTIVKKKSSLTDVWHKIVLTRNNQWLETISSQSILVTIRNV